MLLNLIVVVGLALTDRLGDPGMHALLALSNAVGAIFNAVLLYTGLVRNGVLMSESGSRRLLVQVVAASAVMACFLFWFGGDVAAWIAASTTRSLLWLAAMVGGGGCVYFAALWLMGVRPGQFRMRAPAAAS